MFIDRRRREGRFLEWKVGLFTVAAVFGLAGMYLQETWMTGLAIVLLAGAMGLRFLPGGGVAGEDDVEDEDEDEMLDDDGTATGAADAEGLDGTVR